MDRALWFLLGLRLRGWLRRIGAALRTVKGLLATLTGLILFLGWGALMVFSTPPTDAQHLARVREVGPVALLAFCLLNYFLAAGERVLAFSPAEVNFLFPAPFTRRQLLLYKITALAAGALLLSLFMTVVMRQHTSGIITGLVGIGLAVLFLQFFALMIALLASIVGARAYNRQRRIALVVLVVAVGGLIVAQGGHQLEKPWGEIAADLRQNPVVEVLLSPFIWQINAMTADTLWPELAQWAGLALLANLALLALVLALDAHYLESAAAASEKIYRRLEKLRRGGLAGVTMGEREKSRWSLPNLPRWGGVGPLLWRQLLNSVRSFWWIVPLAIFLSAFLTPMILTASRGDEFKMEMILVLLGTMVAMLGLFMPSLLTFDFRADLDRMEVLKTLPLPAWRIVVGQLLAPVLLVTLVQIVMLAALQAVLGTFEPLLLATPPFLLSFNFFVFGVENLIFLWFPTRQLAATPGDIQNFVRVMVLWLVKFILLMVIFGIGGALAVIAYFIAGESYVAAGLTAWLVVTACALGIVPLLCLAFDRFDVAADTPP